jgi:hypothetical protein
VVEPSLSVTMSMPAKRTLDRVLKGLSVYTRQKTLLKAWISSSGEQVLAIFSRRNNAVVQLSADSRRRRRT